MRNSNLVIFSSVFMLLFSCSQYEIRNRTFDYALYNAFNEGGIKLFVDDSNSEKSLESTKNLLSKINEHYGTDLQIPDNFIQSFLDKDKETILEISLENGWLNQNDINLNNEFIENINSIGFDSAINLFKNKTLSLNLSEEEFSKKNAFVNIMEITHNENPNLFETNSLDNGGWPCFWAVAWFIIALIGMFSCITWILCGFAAYALMEASDELVEQCN